MTPKPTWTPEKTVRVYQAFQTLFTSELGLEVLGYLEEEFAERTSFTPGAPDATAFQEGERSVVLIIQDRLDTLDLGALLEELRELQRLKRQRHQEMEGL